MAYYNYIGVNRASREVEREKIVPNKQEKKENVQIMKSMVDALVTAMMDVDPVFKILFNRYSFTGSYYDGTRVGSASEFDISLVCKLPLYPDDVTITLTPEEPQYVRFKVRRYKMVYLNPLIQRLNSFFVGDYLHLPSFLRWVQSVISKAIDSGRFQKPHSVREWKRSQSGPSFIWYIKTASGRQIDVDFVPVIDGTGYRFPDEIQLPSRFQSLGSEAKCFTLVPKPMKTEYYWRYSFAEAEKLLISSDMGWMKLLIRLFKLLRDKNKWNKITSYYIRNFFLLQLEENPSSFYWRDAELGDLFVEMLKKFQTCVDRKQLPYYFNENVNLFDHLDEETSRRISNDITSLLRIINSGNFTQLRRYFV